MKVRPCRRRRPQEAPYRAPKTLQVPHRVFHDRASDRLPMLQSMRFAGKAQDGGRMAGRTSLTTAGRLPPLRIPFIYGRGTPRSAVEAN
jgi:hypothetical protein